MDFASIKFQPNRPLLREISADRLNTILQEIKRNKPKGERGITVRQDGTGTYVGLAASLGKPTAAQTQPWDLVARRNPSNENQYLVTVQPGTLNGILPTNWDEEFPCASTGLFYAKVVVATDGEAITGITIEIDAAPPSSQSPVKFGVASSVDIVFGLFSEGSIYRTIGSVGNIVASPQLWLTTERQSPPQPGELPFDQYYLLI